MRAILYLPVTVALLILIPFERLQAQCAIEVDFSQTRQTMDGTAGNAYGFITGSNWSPQVVNLIVNDINVTHVRFRSSINNWEPNNDNGDPNVINWSAFKDEKTVHDDFVLLQKLSAGGIECILGVWQVPDWMVTNPQASKNRIIPPSMYAEFAEMIVSYIIYARDNYGAKINIIGIQNEPNIGIYNYFTSEELADVTEVVLSYLDAYDLDYIKLHVGDVNEPAAAIPYFQAAMDRPKIAARAVAASFHTWHNMTPTHLETIRDFTQLRGIQSWATEVGTSPLQSNTYDWALGSMKCHHYSYKCANSSLTFQWTLGGAESSIDPNGTPYPVYHALKHYHQHINPGDIRVETFGDTGTLFTTAFENKATKTLSIVTIDADTYPQDVTYTLKSTAKGFWPQFRAFKTTTSHNYADMGTHAFNPDGSFTYYVDARSFHTFTCEYNNIPKIDLEVKLHAGNPSLADYVFTLVDKDGILKDIKLAGVAFYKGGAEILTLLYNDPNPPGPFEASIDSTGTVLTMKIMGMPRNMGLTLVGGGVDVDGGLAVEAMDI